MNHSHRISALPVSDTILSFAKVNKVSDTGHGVVAKDDARYPERLRQLADAPQQLYYRGQWEDALFAECPAVVGTRCMTRYGTQMTEALVAPIAAAGVTIVSGFMFGIDAVAHQAALAAGGRTIAVMPCGIERIHPAHQAALYGEILRRGLVLSERPGTAAAARWTFPKRNRIVAGLAQATLVIEGTEESGALITASMALDQNREVFAVPGNIDSAKSFGTNELIKQGAKVVTSVEDILDELQPQLAPMLKKDAPTREVSSLTEAEKALFDILTNEPRHIDEIATSMGQSTSLVLSTLLSLELKDLVKQHAGKLFVKL